MEENKEYEGREDRLTALSNLNRHEKSKESEFIVIDTKSGEIREDKGVYNKTTRKKEAQRFVKVTDDFKELLRQNTLSAHDIMVANYCFMFTPYNSNIVSDDKGLPLSQNGLAELTGLSINTVRKSLMRLESIGIIEKVEVKDTIVIRVFGKFSKRGAEVDSSEKPLLKRRKTHK